MHTALVYVPHPLKGGLKRHDMVYVPHHLLNLGFAVGCDDPLCALYPTPHPLICILITPPIRR